jgi:DNA-binding Lrp family transcriptional regulator
MTCEEVGQMLNLSHQTASARIRDLSKDGNLIDSKARRTTKSGRNAVVWVSLDIHYKGGLLTSA